MTDSDEERIERLRRALQERVEYLDAEHPGYATEWANFQETLLRHGGAAVVPPPSPDPMLHVFTTDGNVISPRRIEKVPGRASDCHANVVALWRSGQVVALGTGHGLNGDLWREHSWGWNNEDQLAETTKSSERHFGVRLDGNRALLFADWIDPPRA